MVSSHKGKVYGKFADIEDHKIEFPFPEMDLFPRKEWKLLSNVLSVRLQFIGMGQHDKPLKR